MATEPPWAVGNQKPYVEPGAQSRVLLDRCWGRRANLSNFACENKVSPAEAGPDSLGLCDSCRYELLEGPVQKEPPVRAIPLPSTLPFDDPFDGHHNQEQQNVSPSDYEDGTDGGV